MEEVLIEEWTRDLEYIRILDEASLALVRERIRELAPDKDIADRAALVASELGTNQLRHARAGRIAVRSTARNASAGLEIIAADRGAGFSDPASALAGAPRVSGSLGVGIGAARRLSTELDLDTRRAEGTRIAARVFGPDEPRGREVGVYGHPHPDESVSGDHAFYERRGRVLTVVVCDGLGHGPSARAASSAATRIAADNVDREPIEIVRLCHEGISHTRGVVMAVGRIDQDAATLELASIGNIDVHVCSPRAVKRLGGASGVVGGRGRMARASVESIALRPEEVVVLATDGIATKMSIETDLALLRDHPAIIAQRIVEQFRRADDDVLVLVAR